MQFCLCSLAREQAQIFRRRAIGLAEARVGGGRHQVCHLARCEQRSEVNHNVRGALRTTPRPHWLATPHHAERTYPLKGTAFRTGSTTRILLELFTIESLQFLWQNFPGSDVRDSGLTAPATGKSPLNHLPHYSATKLTKPLGNVGIETKVVVIFLGLPTKLDHRQAQCPIR